MVLAMTAEARATADKKRLDKIRDTLAQAYGLQLTLQTQDWRDEAGRETPRCRTSASKPKTGKSTSIARSRPRRTKNPPSIRRAMAARITGIGSKPAINRYNAARTASDGIAVSLIQSKQTGVFSMFGKAGLGGLMKQAQQMQENMKKRKPNLPKPKSKAKQATAWSKSHDLRARSTQNRHQPRFDSRSRRRQRNARRPHPRRPQIRPGKAEETANKTMGAFTQGLTPGVGDFFR